MTAEKIYADVQTLEPGEYVDLYELDATAISGDIERFHGYTQVGPIWWQGNEYSAWPIKAEGFERTSDGQQPAPRLQVGNVQGAITALCLYLDDMVGATVIVHRTLGKYLDAANFPDGNPTADPAEELPPEMWFVECKTNETPEVVEFELATAMDFDGVMLPRRQIVANVCWWMSCGGYRGPYCGYAGTNYFDKDGNPVDDPADDVCGGRVSDCKLRFGANQPLSYGSFPAADLIRT